MAKNHLLFNQNPASKTLFHFVWPTRSIGLANLLAVGILILWGAIRPVGPTTLPSGPGQPNDDPCVYLPIVYGPPPTLKSLTTHATVTLPQPLAGVTGSFCVWGYCSISPRLYHEPLADGRQLVGWSDMNGNGHVSVIQGGSIERTIDFTSRQVRGLVGHNDGTFAVLLWNASTRAMALSKRNIAGGTIWETSLNTSIARADFLAGDGRLTYGNGLYAAYFTIQGISGGYTGHHGDQLTYVNSSGAIQPMGWNWGCSHSLAELVHYHPGLNQFAPVCASDCYSSKGVLINDAQIVYTSDGDCAGGVSAQLGQITAASQAWKLAFSALDRPCCDGRGVALATIDQNFASSFTWLTNTDGSYERDPVLAHLGSQLQTDRYLVGWRTTNNGVYWLGVITGAGSFLAGPEEVSSAGLAWGDRDDTLRTRPDGSAAWVYGPPNSTQLHLYYFDGSPYIQ